MSHNFPKMQVKVVASTRTHGFEDEPETLEYDKDVVKLIQSMTLIHEGETKDGLTLRLIQNYFRTTEDLTPEEIARYKGWKHYDFFPGMYGMKFVEFVYVKENKVFFAHVYPNEHKMCINCMIPITV